jgi:hypothetical protein
MSLLSAGKRTLSLIQKSPSETIRPSGADSSSPTLRKPSARPGSNLSISNNCVSRCRRLNAGSSKLNGENRKKTPNLKIKSKKKLQRRRASTKELTTKTIKMSPNLQKGPNPPK